MKKTITLIFSAFLLILILGSTAFATGDIYTQGRLYYRIDGESVTIVGSYENSPVVEIPASINGLPVNTIASGAFIDNGYIRTLLLPDTITSVEDNAVGSIDLVYNANVASNTETTPTPAPSTTPGQNNTDVSGNEGNTTGTADGGTGTTTSGGTTTFSSNTYSADIALDEEGNAEIQYQSRPGVPEDVDATDEPTAEPTTEPTAEVSPSPEVSEDDTTEEPKEKEAEPAEAKSSSAAIIIIVAAVAVIAAGAVIIAKKKK